MSEEKSMSYSNHQQVKNGETPNQEKAKRTEWRCTICGYIYEGDEVPSDYICPLCDAPASAFEKM